MNTILIITGCAGSVLAAGAYLRWAVRPVTIAFRAGRACGQDAADEARRDLDVLIRVFYTVVQRRGEITEPAEPAEQLVRPPDEQSAE